MTSDLKALSDGWERRDVSDEEYVAALRQRIEELEREVEEHFKEASHHADLQLAAEARLAKAVEALGEIAGNGCAICKAPDAPCYEVFVKQDDWCWACIARAALAAAKGE